jgi:hypothetical protein
MVPTPSNNSADYDARDQKHMESDNQRKGRERSMMRNLHADFTLPGRIGQPKSLNEILPTRTSSFFLSQVA